MNLDALKTSPQCIDAFEVDSCTILLLKDEFETAVLRRPSGKIVLSQRPPSNTEFAQKLSLQLENSELDYATIRLNSCQHQLVPLLSESFVVVDGIIEFYLPTTSSFSKNLSSQFSEQAQSYSQEIVQLTVEAFSNSRYHQDPILSNELANGAYETWANNIVNLKAADIFYSVLTDDKSFAGYVSLKKVAETSKAQIGLIAVSAKHSGKGFGKQLVWKSLDWCHLAGCDQLLVRTQVFNLPAIKLYLSCGLKVNETFTTLRWARG